MEKCKTGKIGLLLGCVVAFGLILSAIPASAQTEVSVADIVASARVSRSTFYEIFPDKEACFLAAYDAILGRFVTEIIRACQAPELTWPEQIELGIEASLDFMAAEPAFARMCIVPSVV